MKLSSEGYTQREIASKLQIAKGTVTSDRLYLKRQAQTNLKDHIQQDLPHEYQKCITGINQVLKMAWSIVNNNIYIKTRLQALTLINDCNKYKMELSTNGFVISDAIKYVARQQEQLENIKTLKMLDEGDKHQNKRSLPMESFEPLPNPLISLTCYGLILAIHFVLEL